MKYFILKYTDDLPEGFGGATYGPLIKIHPKYAEDEGLLEHEKAHVRQWYALTGFGLIIIVALVVLVGPAFWPTGAVAPLFHSLLYKYVRSYRRWCEVRAYRKQLAEGGYASSDFAVNALVNKYGLDLETKQALDELVG